MLRHWRTLLQADATNTIFYVPIKMNSKLLLRKEGVLPDDAVSIHRPLCAALVLVK